MPVSAAFIAVIVIWSTTPLGIVWSSESVNPIMAALMRMTIAAAVGWIIIKLSKIELPTNRSALRVYAYSNLNVYLGLILTYIAARELSSGVISLIFGMASIVSGILAQKILNEPPLGWARRFALLVSISGLTIVFWENLSLNSSNLPSLILAVLGMFMFSLSSVMVKSVQITIHPMATTVGALIMSVPLYTISWLVMDGTLPVDQWQARSVWAIVYLGIFGSLVGFIAYYYILQRLMATTVALIPLITPVAALTLGALLNNEKLSLSLMVGAGCVMAGLAFYHFGDRLLAGARQALKKAT